MTDTHIPSPSSVNREDGEARAVIARLIDPQAFTYTWIGTEEQQSDERMKACQQRRQQWGDDDCDHDGSCEECAADMAKALETRESKARRVKALAAADAILAALSASTVGADWTIERDANGEAMVCTGCGTTRTLDHIRYIKPKALSCCPERKMIPVREAIATDRANDEQRAREVLEATRERDLFRDTDHLPKVAEDTAIRAMLAFASPVAGGEVERYRHKARGTEYDLIGTAELQDARGDGVPEGALLAIYRGDDGKLWARRHSEFGDGRFERILAALASPGNRT